MCHVLLLLVVLGILVTGTAAAIGTGPAWADPTPAPAPAPGAQSNPTPSPIGPPPTATPTPTTPSTPAPAPGPTPPGGMPTDSGGSPGLFDIPGQVRQAINDFILWIAKTGLKPVMDTLGHTVLSTPDLTSNPQVKAIWTTSLVAANAIFVLFVVAGGFIVASRETLQNRYGLKEIAPRVVVAAVTANVSLIVCGKAIEAVNALTAAIAGQGVDGQGAATAIEQILDQPVSGSLPPILYSLLVLAVLVMAIVVVMTFVLRMALLVMLVGVAPLALMCHATPQTEGLAYTWWRAFAACLGMQLGQAVIILATVRVFLTPAGPEAFGIPLAPDGLLAVLVCLTMLWLLIKLPGWMKHLLLGRLGHSGRGLVGQIIHAVVMLKTLGALAGVGRGTSRPARSARPASSGRPRPGPAATTGAVPRSGGPGPRPPHPTRPRPAPTPPGPAAFSNAPVSHTPLAEPAGTAEAPAFSSAAQPSTPRPAPATGPAPARFSHPPTPTTTIPARTSRPAAPRFSNAPTPPALVRRPTSPVPAATFSAAPRSQTAPKRPPAPVTPVFSTPTRAAPAGGTTPTRTTPTPAPPRPAASGRPQTLPPPSPSRPRPAGRTPPPSVPPSPPRRPRGGRPEEGGES